jgi:hypothetical protein
MNQIISQYQNYLINREGNNVLIEINGGFITPGVHNETINVSDDKQCPCL